MGTENFALNHGPGAARRRHRHPLAIPAVAIAIMGIPLFGIVTGPIAMILAGLVLSQLTVNPHLQGRGLAFAALIIGLVDVLLWVALLGALLMHPHLPTDDQIQLPFFPSAEVLAGAPEPIRLALESNVLVGVYPRRRGVFSPRSFQSGSGVIVGSEGERVLILTSRHLVDSFFDHTPASSAPSTDKITVHFTSGISRRARLVWVAPHGVDAAMLVAGHGLKVPPVSTKTAGSQPTIGAKVFTVGNPHEYTWSYTEGVISGVREKRHGPMTIRVFQTQTPVNAGSSGGGLYLSDGQLAGIVTWTKHKAHAEGMSFALSYRDLIDLYRTRSR